MNLLTQKQINSHITDITVFELHGAYDRSYADRARSQLYADIAIRLGGVSSKVVSNYQLARRNRYIETPLWGSRAGIDHSISIDLNGIPAATITQPYDWDYPTRIAAEQSFEQQGLIIREIANYPQIHFPGRTTMLLITPILPVPVLLGKLSEKLRLAHAVNTHQSEPFLDWIRKYKYEFYASPEFNPQEYFLDITEVEELSTSGGEQIIVDGLPYNPNNLSRAV